MTRVFLLTYHHRRKSRGDGDVMSGGGMGMGNKQRKPEIGIKIFVPDYRSTLQS